MNKLIENKRFSVYISEDEMIAWIRFHTDEPVCVSHLQERLAHAEITYGVDHFLLEDLADAHQPEKLYCIARGTPPEEGLKYHFQPLPEPRPRRLSDGRVDFYNMQTVQYIAKQQVLVSKIPQEERQQGLTITHKPTFPLQLDSYLPKAGANVELQEIQQSLIALVDGYPTLINNILSVDPIYTVEGDIDFSIGNLDIYGPIIVSGNIKNGFHIRSQQSVTVYGVVDGGSIDALGKILLYGNVFGKNQSQIVSDDSIEGMYLDATSVTARNDIILDLGARHCSLQAGGSILIRGQSGHIIGGNVTAHDQILTHNLGSESEVPTFIEILPGIYDLLKSRECLNSIKKIIDDDYNFVDQSLDFEFTSDQRNMMARELDEFRHSITCLTTYFSKRRDLLPIRPLQIGTITVTGTIYPGVVLTIGNTSLKIRHNMTNVLFYKDGNDISIKNLDN